MGSSSQVYREVPEHYCDTTPTHFSNVVTGIRAVLSEAEYADRTTPLLHSGKESYDQAEPKRASCAKRSAGPHRLPTGAYVHGTLGVTRQTRPSASDHSRPPTRPRRGQGRAGVDRPGDLNELRNTLTTGSSQPAGSLRRLA